MTAHLFLHSSFYSKKGFLKYNVLKFIFTIFETQRLFLLLVRSPNAYRSQSWDGTGNSVQVLYMDSTECSSCWLPGSTWTLKLEAKLTLNLGSHVGCGRPGWVTNGHPKAYFISRIGCTLIHYFVAVLSMSLFCCSTLNVLTHRNVKH